MKKNNCRYTDKDIWNYYSNLLSREEEADVQEHILACRDCKRKLDRLRNIADSLDEEVEVKEDAPRVVEIPKKKSVIRPYLFAAASIAVIVLVIKIAYPDLSKDPVQPQGDEHPVYNIDNPSYYSGDTAMVESDGVNVALELDTILVDHQ